MATSELAIRQMSKEELVNKAISQAKRLHTLATQHKPMLKRMGMTVVQSGIATGVGLGCGALELKFRKLPVIGLRTDLAAAGVIALFNLANVFEEGTPLAQSAADAFTGHGMGRLGEKFLLARGVKAST